MSSNTLSSSSIPNSSAHLAIELSIAQERLRQARYSFNLALAATTASVCISLTGAGLLLFSKAPEGTITAVAGIASSVRCIQLAKDANDRLDRIARDLING
ncbi:TRADD-N-associated membrane domain-containing protein [Fischerella sp. PCC 9605]|uniref:TRADD-N-associated membrane domain-containing protein n=1 Tax=Fischerella sp. PCC 9605 TaxID=1173024 RepID=UPI0004B3564D|nr:hypothetical protein [Fischerella sp. PCC 9605]